MTKSFDEIVPAVIADAAVEGDPVAAIAGEHGNGLRRSVGFVQVQTQLEQHLGKRIGSGK